jgi:hypothetical protein
MKKQLTKISTLAFALLSFGVFGQERVQPCNTYEAMEQHFAEDPQARKNYEAAQEQLRMQLENSASKSTAAFEYTVPVVFHILYECNGPTITDAEITQALKEVNDDYSRNSSDTNQIVQPFKSSYINSEIKFMLAKKDPQGNCINGIVRHYDPARTHWQQGTANSAFNTAYWAYTWDPTKYLNIYVVAEIVPQGTVTGGGIIVGYTYRPGTWSTGNAHDAIVYNINYLTGSNGGAPRTRSLSHEIGHWLSLAHTWGNSNNPQVACGDDGITDTPVTKGEFGGCASSLATACTQTNPAMAGLNNVQNIMNYSDCPRNFTTGQTTNMRNTLAGTVSGRSNLYSSLTLASTDVDGSGLCAPVSEFFSTNCSYTVCQGSSLTFKDFSFNGTITSVQWDADNGGQVASPNASITSITFPNSGTSIVSFTATNNQGSHVKTRAITVTDNTPAFGPIAMESFEFPGLPPYWSIHNEENDAITWEQTTDAAYDQATSYRVSGMGNPDGNSDILQMPTMDVMNNPNDILEFAYAFRKHTTSNTDALKIEGSKDCGGTWQTIYTLNSNFMSNGSGGLGTDGFVPAINEWKIYTISSHPNWQSYKTSSNVKVRFNFIAGGGTSGSNNMYVDAINWYSTVGVNELTKSIHFNLYPNPSNGEANISFTLSDPATIKVSVLDVMGREVLPAVENAYNPGAQTLTLNKNNTLSKGIYFVNLSLNGAKMSRKLIIE